MSESVIWTTEAEAKLKEIPFFVRPAARKEIEKFAPDADIREITLQGLDEAAFAQIGGGGAFLIPEQDRFAFTSHGFAQSLGAHRAALKVVSRDEAHIVGSRFGLET